MELQSLQRSSSTRSITRASVRRDDPDTAESLHEDILREPEDTPTAQFTPITRRDQYVVLICGFLSVFQTIAPNLSYGVFQDFYVSSPSTILPPSQASARGFVALVGTLGAGLTWGGSIYVNPIMARLKSFKPIALTGAILMSLGYFLASFSTQVGHVNLIAHHSSKVLYEIVSDLRPLTYMTQSWHLLLTLGLLYGIGSSMLYFPLVTVVPE